MNNNKSKMDNAADRLWDRYIKFIQKQGVKGSACRWYVKRIEQYTQAYPDQKLLTHTPETVTRFLGNEGRNTQLKDWQFIQAVDAIQKLFIMIDTPCLDKVEWAHWRSFAHTLPQSHATLAREVSVPREPGKTDKDALAMVRRDYASFLTALVAEIRQRHYSIRTEQVYELWVCRFILLKTAPQITR